MVYWFFSYFWYKVDWGHACQMQISWPGISDYIPQYLCDVITCPCACTCLCYTSPQFREQYRLPKSINAYLCFLRAVIRKKHVRCHFLFWSCVNQTFLFLQGIVMKVEKTGFSWLICLVQKWRILYFDKATNYSNFGSYYTCTKWTDSDVL